MTTLAVLVVSSLVKLQDCFDKMVAADEMAYFTAFLSEKYPVLMTGFINICPPFNRLWRRNMAEVIKNVQQFIMLNDRKSGRADSIVRGFAQGDYLMVQTRDGEVYQPNGAMFIVSVNQNAVSCSRLKMRWNISQRRGRISERNVHFSRCLIRRRKCVLSRER